MAYERPHLASPTAQLHELAVVTGGWAERTPKLNAPGSSCRMVPISAIGAAPARQIMFERCPSFEPENQPGDAALRTGDLLMPSRGERHDVALVGELPAGVTLVAAEVLYVIRPDPAVIDPCFLTWWLNSRGAQSAIRELARGSKVSFIPIRSLRTLTVPVPPQPLQIQIVKLSQLTIHEATLLERIRALRLELNDAIGSMVVGQGSVK